MESLQENFIIEMLNEKNVFKIEDKHKNKLQEISAISLSKILNQASPSGSDMNAVFCLFDNLFLDGSKSKVREKGLYNLSKTIQKWIKKMNQMLVKSKEGFIYSTHFFSPDIEVVIKIPQKSYGIESKIREYFIGINSLNKLRCLIPTFVYTLGAFLHPKPSKTGELEIDDTKNKKTAFVIYEKIPGESVFTLLKNDIIDFNQFLFLFVQLLLGLEVAQREVRFTHFDMHAENVMVKIADGNSSSYSVPLDFNIYSVNNPKMIPVIIDFGAATTYIEGKYVGSYDYTKHGMLNFMVPGHDMYKFLVYCVRKSVNKELKSKIIQLFKFYEDDDDPYFIYRDGELGIEKAVNTYCKETTFSGAASYTPLMFIKWLMTIYSTELSNNISVTKRNNYLSVQYSSIIKEYQNIFCYTKKGLDEVLFLANNCITTIPSYIMASYNIKVLERYNYSLKSCELNSKIESLKKKLIFLSDKLIDSDMNMLKKVFDIEIPSQENLDRCIKKVLEIKIRHSNANTKKQSVKDLDTILLYQKELSPYLQFYFTILELKLEHTFKDWIKKFKSPNNIYRFHINNVTKNERAIRWGQTLMGSIII
jgi:hypothetical protein